jgi:hypothetical protein
VEAKRVRTYAIRGTILDLVIRESAAFTGSIDPFSSVYSRQPLCNATLTSSARPRYAAGSPSLL